MIAEQRPDATDGPRTIRIFQDEHDAVRTRFDVPAVHIHDPRRRAEESAGHRNGFAFGHGGKLEQVGVIAGRALPAFGNF